ncbi:RsmB/NOP family class I SAM-dependent RNA methyltransferase [Desulfurococcaceae archaeon MEX13E-LK6-19]|nr:RsmB/NOP family class I SAM-dependent RNA methyltransferase [Desulfurococcaceae archaeon MEX13E-LK6-19]
MASMRTVVYAVVESVILGEKIKPIQEAVRRVLYRYRISDEVLFKKISGLVYNIFRNHGLVDYIVENLTGLSPRDLNSVARGVLRVAGYVFQIDTIMSDKWRHKFHKHLIEYSQRKLGSKSKTIVEAIEKITRVKWSPSSKYEEFMLEYRIHPGLYRLLEEAFRELNEDLDKFLKETLKPPPYHVLRVNMLKASRDAILKYLSDRGYRVEPGKYSPQAIRVYGSLGDDIIKLIETGVVTPQDEASMVAVELLPLREGIVVADLCAAPGNKTSYVAERTRLKAEIHAFDVNRDRIKRMRRLLERTGTDKVVKIYHMDARKAVDILGRESMDIVLVDPPCSSTGALARNPDVRWRYEIDELKEINELQKQLLETAAKIVKKGGYILYTTCSVLPSEGEYVVKHVLEKHDNLELVSLNRPFKKSPLLEETMRSYPHIHGVTGFFYALIKKKY